LVGDGGKGLVRLEIVN